jgi:hypothetical protein
MKKEWIRILALIILFLPAQGFMGYGQVYVAGPSCVVPATEYQYNLSSNWTDTSQIQVCITGGVFAGSGDSCYNGTPLRMVRVVWNDTTVGRLYISSSAGVGTLNVNMTHALQGGKIDSTAAIQVIQAGTIPSSIHCTGAAGGSCAPGYQYQWQQSSDNVVWNDIPGADDAQLTISAVVNSTVYYRRKVTEPGSVNEAYSDVAMVIVTVPNP